MSTINQVLVKSNRNKVKEESNSKLQKSKCLLEENLKQFQQIMSDKFKLTIDEETVQEIVVHFLSERIDLKIVTELNNHLLENSSKDFTLDGDNGISDVNKVSHYNVETNSLVKCCQKKWQFWFWKADQRYPKWDYGLQKLLKPICVASKLKLFQEQLLGIHEVGK